MYHDEFYAVSRNIKIALNENILKEIPESEMSDDELIDRLLNKIHGLEFQLSEEQKLVSNLKELEKIRKENERLHEEYKKQYELCFGEKVNFVV